MNVQTAIPDFRTHGEIEASGRREEEPGIDCGQGRSSGVGGSCRGLVAIVICDLVGEGSGAKIDECCAK